MTMVYPGVGPGAESVPQPWAAEQAFRAGARAEQAFRRARAAQRAAAISLDHSAASQDRTAQAFEGLAERERCDRQRDQYLAYAARHRASARDDREMACRLRQTATT